MAAVFIARDDVEACIRLVEGQSLPLDMEPWRDGLLRRLRAALAEGPGFINAESLLSQVAKTMKYGYWRGPNCWQGVDFSRSLKEAIEEWAEGK